MSIDVSDEMHKIIKVSIAYSGKTIRDFVLEAITNKIEKEKEPNEVTAKAIEDSRRSRDLIKHSSLNDLYQYLGIND